MRLHRPVLDIEFPLVVVALANAELTTNAGKSFIHRVVALQTNQVPPRPRFDCPEFPGPYWFR